VTYAFLPGFHLAARRDLAYLVNRSGGGQMFGLLDGFKYRSEVIVEIHAILKFVPELKSLLKTTPKLKSVINELRKMRMPELEAAAHLSLVVIERVISNIPAENLALTLQQLDEKKDDWFRWFAKSSQAIMKGASNYPKGMPILTIALGHAFWYLGFAVRENRLSEQAYKTFIGDVAGMLRGKSVDERRVDRLMNALEGHV
jgi:hypothetical protein